VHCGLQLLNGSTNLLQGRHHSMPPQLPQQQQQPLLPGQQQLAEQLQQQRQLQQQLQHLTGTLVQDLLPEAAAAAAFLDVPEPISGLQMHGRSAAAAGAAGIDGVNMLAGQLQGISSMGTGDCSDPLDAFGLQGSLLTDADDLLLPEVTSSAAAGAGGSGNRAAAAAPAGVALQGCVHSLNMRWLMQQLPRGCILESIMTGLAGMCGVLYTLPQQQALQQAVPAGTAAPNAAAAPWYVVVWDGAGWHRVGTYGCERDAVEACNYVLDLAAECGDAGIDEEDEVEGGIG
jgi:hypothetical protein